jgi:hypothetical protein
MGITLAVIIAFIASNTPSWLAILRTTVLDTSGKMVAETSKGLVVSKGGNLIRRVLHLDEKEQIRHLEQALKNAIERGFANFTTPTEQEQYKHVLYTLMKIGPHSEKLRREALSLFTLSDTPDFTSLNEAYHLAHQDTALSHKEVSTNIAITPYLTSFFNALMAELYADPYFKQQMQAALQIRATLNMQQALFNVVTLLQEIGETLEQTYTPEHLVQDVEQYTAYLQRTFHHLKIVGIVPKDQGKRDPELGRIFVPLRIALQDQDLPH